MRRTRTIGFMYHARRGVVRAALAAAVTLAGLTGARIAQADLYVYVDENGTPHYSNEKKTDAYTLVHKQPDKPFSPRDMYVCIDKNGAYRFATQALTPCYKKHTSFTWKTLGKTKEFDDGFYDGLIWKIAHDHGMEYALVKAVIKTESDFDSKAVSRAGALGLMQLMPETAAAHGVANPLDPMSNIDGGVRFLAYLYNRYRGNLDLTLAAYNAGETAVAKYHGIPPYSETRRYIHKVRTYLDQYRYYRTTTASAY